MQDTIKGVVIAGLLGGKKALNQWAQNKKGRLSKISPGQKFRKHEGKESYYLLVTKSALKSK